MFYKSCLFNVHVFALETSMTSSTEHISHWHCRGTVTLILSVLNGAEAEVEMSSFGHRSLTCRVLTTASLHWKHECCILQGIEGELCAFVTHVPTHEYVSSLFGKQSLYCSSCLVSLRRHEVAAICGTSSVHVNITAIANVLFEFLIFESDLKIQETLLEGYVQK